MHEVSGLGRERDYSAGYGPLVLKALSERDLKVEGAFFLPHLKPGMSLLDCGCGPGALTVQLAAIVAPGVVVGLDRHGDQHDIGQRQAVDVGLTNVSFREGSIYELPFEDETFDAVFAHAVLYHLGDPAAALREMYRVLRPGGVVGIRDSDLGGDVRAPSNDTLDRGFDLIHQVLRYNGGQSEFGREHRRMLREAGFERIVASASYDYFGVQEHTRGFSEYWCYFLDELHRELVLSEGWSTEDQIAVYLEAFRAWGRDPDAFFARCRCEGVGYRP
jgi:ubiquinone/menaquinone biosynthesis C-methylase UbiE